MGFLQAAAAVARDLVGMPRMITLDLQPAATFDTAPRPVDMLLAAMRNGDMTRVGRAEALSIAGVIRGRNEVCAIATLPMRLYKGLSAVDNPLFRQWDPNVPNVVHMAMTVEDLLFDRVAWWRKTGFDFDGYPAAVQRIDPCKVRLDPPGKGSTRDTAIAFQAPPIDQATDRVPGRWVWIDQGGGEYEQVDSRLMIRFDSPNPGIMISMARMMRVAIALDRLIEMYATNPSLRELYTDNPDSDEDEFKDDDITAFLAEIAAMRQLSPYGWLPSNVKRADVTSPSPKDLTLVELRQEVNLAIAIAIGVDPEDLGVSTTSRTYFNSVDKKQEKINRTYGPFMSALVDRLQMGDVTRRGYVPQFDLTDYLKSDPVTQASYWKALKDMSVVDEQWIGEQAGIDPAVTARAVDAKPAAAVPAADAGLNNVRPLRTAAAFDNDGPAFRFNHTDFGADAPAAPTVDAATRTITGLAVPYGAVANKYGMKITFDPGSLEYSAPERMAALQDHMTPVGFHRSVQDTAAGPLVALAVLDGPDGSAAKANRDQLLYDAANGLYSGLSVGVDYSLDPEDGDVTIDDDGVVHVVRATWRETSITYMPAFDDARVTQVAASREGNPVDPCKHCGHRHAANIACATFARQLQPAAGAPGTALVPANAPTSPGAPAAPLDPQTFAQYQAFVDFQAAQALAANGGQPADAPILVNPHHGPAQVREPSPYRFDRKGNLRAGSHDFSSDLFAGWKHGDQAAQDRAQSFVSEAFAERNVGNLAPLTPEQQFAITPANVVNLNYPANRPEMYVDQLDYQYPMYNAMDKGTLDAVTPFVIPKFNSSSGLVADHVTGTEPTPGAFTATAQTITPSAMSGKVEITREAFDQGGNPQMSGLIWRQMVRAWYEGLEAFAQAQLVAAAASITDIVITTAAVDSTLDGLLADAMVPLQYIRGGDRFRNVYTQIDLYKALVKAKDSTGRRLYPSLGAVNAVGQADPRYAWVEAHGKLWIPAWATAATSVNAASSWMFDPDVVCLWASAPQRIDIVWRVAWVDMGIWGYKAFGVTDFTRTRELVYDPV